MKIGDLGYIYLSSYNLLLKYIIIQCLSGVIMDCILIKL